MGPDWQIITELDRLKKGRVIKIYAFEKKKIKNVQKPIIEQNLKGKRRKGTNVLKQEMYKKINEYFPKV